MHKRITVAPMVLCECNTFNFGLEAFDTYLRGESVVCRICDRSLDYLADARRASLASAHALVGGKSINTAVGGTWTLGDTFRIVIPGDAVLIGKDYMVLTLSWKPEHCWALEGFGALPASAPQKSVALRCIESTDRLEYDLLFAPLEESNDQSWLQLVRAVEAFVLGDYATMCFSANIAVESMLERSLRSYLKLHFKADKAKKFLRRNDYSEWLSYLMPIFAENAEAPPLPKEIRVSLQVLLERRNEIGHAGHLLNEMDRDSAASLLADSSLGFFYMQILGAMSRRLLTFGSGSVPSTRPFAPRQQHC